MASSQLLQESRRPQRPTQQLEEPLQIAPYLTHVVAHHGQLTLVPPQNAGRIRKSKSVKKKSSRQPSSRDRRPEDDEPRFTTAVPASSSRKLHPAPAHIRTRKHAISAPSPTTPTSPRRYEPDVDGECCLLLSISSLISAHRPVHSGLSSAVFRGCHSLSTCATTPHVDTVITQL
ncbi:hypothetical protein C2E23DRAFT_403549 [Lenzites betulinus]|nr:hypothetical protein C2E23DRAFT_403549 [Lenzites betulinus]